MNCARSGTDPASNVQLLCLSAPVCRRLASVQTSARQLTLAQAGRHQFSNALHPVDPRLHCDRAGVRALTSRRAAGTAFAAALAACAPHPRTAPQFAVASSCLVADTTAAARDTIYVVGTGQGNAYAGQTDCARLATLSAAVVVVEAPGAGADLRDVLDRGLSAADAHRPDVVVSRDPRVISYANSSRDYFTVALPYDRTYMLVGADTAASLPTPAERDALARDAVTADVRGANEPFEWRTDPGCSTPPDSPPDSPNAVVAYAGDDPIARQLAERIVALTGARGGAAWLPTELTSAGTTPRVAAVDADSIAAVLATGRATAAVVAVQRDPRIRCSTKSAPFAWRGIPLVDSRAHAIVRRGSGAAFIIAPDGSLRFVRRSAP